MKDPTYYNGVICPYDSVAIPLSDRSIFFADSIYEVMIGRNSKIYQFNEHFARLVKNCASIGLNFETSQKELSEIVDELISLGGYDEFSLYIQVSANSKKRAHLRGFEKANLLVAITQINVPDTPNKVKAITYPDLRYGYCNLKTTNLLPSVLSINEAVSMNADLSIFHRGNTVTECSHANIAILIKGKLKTPPLNKNILPGITRSTLIETCKKMNIECLEKRLCLSELFEADAVLISSTTKLLQICTEIDGIVLPTAAESLAKLLFDAIHSDFFIKTT